MQDILQDIQEKKQDAIFWQCEQWLLAATGDIRQRAKAMNNIAELLSCIKEQFERQGYVNEVSRAYKIPKRDLTKTVQDKVISHFHDEEEEDDRKPILPEWADPDVVMEFGFTELVNKNDTGYYFLGENNRLNQITNFVVTPLYHIYSQKAEDNRRMIEVTNGFTSSIAELPSKGMLSPEQFCAELYNHGTYLPRAGFAKSHLLKMLNKISNQFTFCYEMQKLGWQPEGFFAFSNTTYTPPAKRGQQGVMAEYDDFGVVPIGDKNFLSPSNSKANALVRDTDNLYENDLYLKYTTSSIDFNKWAELMVGAYLQNAWFAIPFAVATLFRDVVIKTTKIPHLYAYGAVGTGKSEFGESIVNLFFAGKDSQGEHYKPFNLNQGTEYAFWNGMERFVNCPYALNEFDENTIEENRFRAIKSAYDSEGRAKGMKDKNRATMQKVVCTLILMGQYLGTKDDNSVLMRSLPILFKLVDLRPEEQLAAFKALKDAEQKGISNILTELLDLRPVFEVDFSESFAIARKVLIEDLRREGHQVPERIIKNISCMIATVDLVGSAKELPFTKDEFYQYAKAATIRMSSTIHSSSGINKFWQLVESMNDRFIIKEHEDFEIEGGLEQVKVYDNLKDGEMKSVPANKKVLFLRLNNVHTMYAQEEKKGSNGKSGFNQETLKTYLKDQPYYLGWVKGKRFKGKVTSCFAFIYEDLDISLERIDFEEDRQKVTIEALIVSELRHSGNDMGTFYIKETIADTDKEGNPQSKEISYKCTGKMQELMGGITKDYKIKVTGYLNTMDNGQKVYRNIDVMEFEAVPGYGSFTGVASSVSPADNQGDLF